MIIDSNYDYDFPNTAMWLLGMSKTMFAHEEWSTITMKAGDLLLSTNHSKEKAGLRVQEAGDWT